MRWLALLLCAACGDDAAGPDAATTTGEPAELAGIVARHNQVRAMVNAQPPLPVLVWDDSLAATAADWVAQCRDDEMPYDLIDHNPQRSQGHPYYVGENIYATSALALGGNAVDSWASEARDYDYPSNTCSGACGHYTQLVWRTTLAVGCARRSCPNLKYSSTIVCDYGPGGNTGDRPY